MVMHYHAAGKQIVALRTRSLVGRPPCPRQHPVQKGGRSVAIACGGSHPADVKLNSKQSSSILHKMLSDFAKIMGANFPEVSWMLHKGTLLSLCRDGGMLPWGDDVDVYIALSDVKTLSTWVG